MQYLSGEPLTLDENNMLSVAQLAHSWAIPSLHAACERFIDERLCNANVATLFNASCELGAVTHGLTMRMWESTHLLGMQASQALSDTALQWITNHPKPAFETPRTLMQLFHVNDNPSTVRLRMHWFEPKALPQPRQGKSETRLVQGIPMHLKRLVGRTSSPFSEIADFSLRMDIPPSFPAQGGVMYKSDLCPVGLLDFTWSLVPSALHEHAVYHEAVPDYLSTSDDSNWSSSDSESPRGSDDEGDTYQEFGKDKSKVHLPRETKGGVVAFYRHPTATTSLSIDLCKQTLEGFELPFHEGIFRADGSQHFELDAVLRWLPVRGDSALHRSQLRHACPPHKQAEAAEPKLVPGPDESAPVLIT